MSRQEELENDYQVALKGLQIDIMYLANANPLTGLDKREAATSLFYLESMCRVAIRKLMDTYTKGGQEDERSA